jgi:molybdopterin-containing oxidoreductase family iron-sulfur binding subunit
MKEKTRDGSGESTRRNFIKKIGAGIGTVSIAGITGSSVISGSAKTKSGEKVLLLSPEGKLVEVDRDDISPAGKTTADLKAEAKIGLPGHKFVMVIDLSKCRNARLCVDACQEGHMLPKDHEWMKLYLLQDTDIPQDTVPRPCFHCDKPMCVSVASGCNIRG